MLRVDVREIYLKRLVTLERYNHASFKTAYNLILLFLQNDNDPSDVEEAEMAVEVFLSKFRNEKGTPSLDFVLYQLDRMRVSGKQIMRIKSKFKRKKYSYQEIVSWLSDVEDYLLSIVRKKAASIRITNPELALV